MAPVLDIQDLSTHIKLTSSVVQAVGNIDLHVEAGETLGIVGESGCGKSMTGLSIMGLLPPGGSIVGGSIKLNDRELVGLKDEEMRRLRGNEVAMIFQDPLTSLDPTKTIGYQVGEPVRLHRGASKSEALDRAVEVLSLVGLPRPKERLSDYPHQLSGGLRQRVMIAMALACEPKLLIADEPTTALDVTIQAQILALLKDLKERLGMGMLLITHDMGVIAGHADRVNVMYAGRVVETAEAVELFDEMHHPYTQALLAAIPPVREHDDVALFALEQVGIPDDRRKLVNRLEQLAAEAAAATDYAMGLRTQRHNAALHDRVGQHGCLLCVEAAHSLRHEEGLDHAQKQRYRSPGQQQVECTQSVAAEVEMVRSEAAQKQRQQHPGQFLTLHTRVVGVKGRPLLIRHRRQHHWTCHPLLLILLLGLVRRCQGDKQDRGPAAEVTRPGCS